MTLKELEINQESLKKLDAYSASGSPCQFLQSSAWLKFQESIGHKAHIFSGSYDNKIIYFSVFENQLPLGKKYYYIPRGPVLASADLWPLLLSDLNSLFKKNKTLVFVRLEPDATFVNNNLKRVIDVQPCNTFYTDLKNSEEEILNLMHSKTRYNIRLGLKKDLQFLANDADFESFWNLMEETTQRDKFSSHHKSYYEEMVISGAAQLATVRHNNKVIAAGIFSKFGNTMTYLHGASSSANRELMAPYVLHWLMIQQAKNDGLAYYDWHGINEKKWPGVTRFKLGFSGHNVDYPGTFDLILAPTIYLGYNIARGIRRLFPSLRSFGASAGK